jgi:hypothetical protein
LGTDPERTFGKTSGRGKGGVPANGIDGLWVSACAAGRFRVEALRAAADVRRKVRFA